MERRGTVVRILGIGHTNTGDRQRRVLRKMLQGPMECRPIAHGKTGMEVGREVGAELVAAAAASAAAGCLLPILYPLLELCDAFLAPTARLCARSAGGGVGVGHDGEVYCGCKLDGRNEIMRN